MIKRMIAAIGLFLALGASVGAQTYVGTLEGAQESPPNASPGTGNGSAIYNAIDDTLTVHVDFSGLSANAQDAHIHCCFGELTDPPGRNASVAIGFTLAGFPFGVTSGTYDHVFDLTLAGTYTGGFLAEGGGTPAGARNKLLAAFNGVAGAGGAYFNIHTPNFPGGEIRGDISLIPEPTSLVLLVCGVAGVAAVRRRR